MGSQWESILVALGIILLFYFSRRYYLRDKPPIKPPYNPQTPHPIRAKNKNKQLQVVRKKINHKAAQTKTSQNSNQVASLVMHPLSIERAKKEFLQYAQRFRGSYESLYLTCYGKPTGILREQVLRNWEEGIRATEAQNFILVWNTIVQKHCGRNYYLKGTPRWARDAKVENEILHDWLKQLFIWGLLRELRGQTQSTELGGEPRGGNAEPEKTCWLLNGEILEEGQERVKSLGQ